MRIHGRGEVASVGFRVEKSPIRTLELEEDVIRAVAPVASVVDGTILGVRDESVVVAFESVKGSDPFLTDGPSHKGDAFQIPWIMSLEITFLHSSKQVFNYYTCWRTGQDERSYV